MVAVTRQRRGTARSDEPGTRVPVAGLITRRVLQRQEVASFDSKLTAGAFGTFVPFAPAVAVAP
jgi:hypothetical protein